MIIYTKGNIFEAVADAYVNPVNCVGAMGAGLAKQFAEQYPSLLAPYKKACSEGKIKPGEIWIHTADGIDILNLATKDHWRDESKLAWVDQGILNLADLIEENNYKTVAVPALGCGYGRLKWEDVKYLIQESLEGLECNIVVFEPNHRKFLRRKPLRPNPTATPKPIKGVAVGE